MLGQSIVGILMAMMLVAQGADTRLADAAKQGDKVQVQALLKQKVAVNGAKGDGNTALHWAAYRDDVEMTRVLLQAGADVKAKTRIGGMTPLFLAAKNGNAAVISLLLKAGADPNAASETGTTPLMLAAGSGETDAVKALLDVGADKNAKDNTNGQTPLMFAAALGRASTIKLLAERGADLNALSNVSPIKQIARRNNNDTDRREDVTSMGGNGALHYAAREGHIEAVWALVEAGANVNLQSGSDKISPLIQALIIGHFDIAKYLIERGADVGLASASGIAPLYAVIDAKWAQKSWYPPPLGIVEQEQTTYIDLVKMILAKGVDLNAKLERKPWYRAFGNNYGADPAGSTAFWRAAQANDITVMRLLVAAGADPNIATTHGSTPLQVAAGMHYSQQAANLVPEARMDTVKYLVEELKADVNARDDKGYSVLHGAALIGRNDIILYLVDKGANLKVRAHQFSGSDGGGGSAVATPPDQGDTVADIANGWTMNAQAYPETVALLIGLGSDFSSACWASICVNPTRPERSRP